MRIHVSSWNGVGGCEWELPFDGDTRGERHYAKVFTVNNKKTWDEYYLHYTEQLYPDSIIIKTDDDIVFIDAESFEEFIHQRIRHEAPLLLFPNIVNNETCLVHQQSMGLAPGRLPPRALWGSGRNCLALHDSFLNNFDRWIESSRKRNDIVPVDRSERTNINFFAILSKDLHSYRLVASDPDKEDERVITTVATKTLLRSNFVSMKMTVAHLAFFKQRDTGLDEESVLEMYRELARKFLGRSRKSR